MAETKNILVAPLNWGLGHATRCIPIIQSLLDHGATVTIGADGRPLDLLTDEFPSLPSFRLPGLEIRYDGNLIRSMIRQLPQIAAVTYAEHRALPGIIRERKIDAVISDNRFGLYTSEIPCVYLTHQIRIMMPPALMWASNPVATVQTKFIDRFTECWIPDFEDDENLSGDLAHAKQMSSHSFFIGPLSRFHRIPEVPKTLDLIAVLSGPEPQRSIFEQIVIEQLHSVHLKALVVQGIPGTPLKTKISDTVSMVSHLPADKLNRALLSAEVVLSRPGYSTIMDLAALGLKALFIPTPGQTEQEYLAERFYQRRIFYKESQHDFNLQRALNAARQYTGLRHNSPEPDALAARIRHLLDCIP